MAITRLLIIVAQVDCVQSPYKDSYKLWTDI
jgi:hypothetical protein